MKLPNRALFIGRFQPLHNGHVKAIRWLLKQERELVIVLGSSQEINTKLNPFSAGERIEMFRLVFTKSELSRMLIIPVPDINDHPRWVNHLLSYVPKCKSIYSNNEFVLSLFSNDGKLEARHTPIFDLNHNEGTKIRKLIQSSNPSWKKYVPKKIAAYIESIDGIKRIKNLV